MDKICKQYIKEIKTLLPLKQKAERKYLKKLQADIDDYCENANVVTKYDLYENYGTPAEVVRNYITFMDTKVLMKSLRFSKIVRACTVILIIAIIVATGAYCLNQHLMTRVWENNLGYYIDTVIVVEEVIED